MPSTGGPGSPVVGPALLALGSRRRPASRGGEGPEDPQSVDMRDHEVRTEAREHAGTVVPLTELPCRDVQQGTDMATEALRRAVVEMVRHVRDREAGVFEETGGSDEACHRQISLRSRYPGTEEATHERAWR